MKKAIVIFFVSLNCVVFAQTQSVLISNHNKVIKKLIDSEKTGSKKIAKINAKLIFSQSDNFQPLVFDVTHSLADTVIFLPDNYQKASLKKIQLEIQFDQFYNRRLITSGPIPTEYNPDTLKKYINLDDVKQFNHNYYVNHPGGNRVETFTQNIHYYEVDEEFIVCTINSIPAGLNAEVYDVPKIHWEDKYHLPDPSRSQVQQSTLRNLLKHRIGNTATGINFNASDEPYYLIFGYQGTYYVRFMDPVSITPKNFTFQIP